MLTDTRAALPRLVAAFLGACAIAVSAQAAPVLAAGDAVIPRPMQASAGQGVFVLGPATPVIGRGAAAATAAQLAAALHLPIGAGKSPAIVLEMAPPAAGARPEAYALSVAPDRIRIRASDSAGLFYGAQSLRQLVLAAHGAPLPAVEISDAPRFAWRGLLVDVANHFFPKQVLMGIMDQMAYYKLNVLHLHLTDDSGWRLAIPAYPKLTENEDGQFYTADDIRALVAYAEERHITVVPTVEMPSHAGTSARAYPQFFDGGHSINPANPDSYRFIEAVFAEVARLFPSPVLHFGGDELALGSNWNSLPEVQALRQQLGGKDLRAVEGHFDRRVAQIIRGLGRQAMAWDEAFSAGVDHTVIQWWRKAHPEARDQAVKAGFDVVLSPVDQVYFDYPQGLGEPGAPWEGNDNGPTSLAKVLAWEPVPADYTPAELSRVRGVEACIWTEYIRTESFLQFMLYPRMMGFAEVAWSPAGPRDMEKFEARLQPQVEQLDAAGITVRHGPDDASKYMVH
ncbi:beta-N-acetylhexosaminidase [Massilia terrae]|uniref:beta-N-acetylhexosaminidase n=1 Tax=Massilia terrae TaxID=1811224 RepID=A0ABT2CT16_9BURK|nr:beta-N-acetylhexosaminidase [Massilia terrae]MCS0657121.1 beta-N-acetylhexosaminidase [Massilia terrae]